MKSIRIKNMRSLRDTGVIELKNINILVGTNSSGKSTFLRVFPLLKQSFFKRINGPILWAGEEEDYVDFGSYKETINKTAVENCITLEFTIPYNVKEIIRHFGRLYIFKRIDRNKYNYDYNEEATISIDISNKENVDFISEIRLSIGDSKLVMDNVNGKQYFDGKEIKRESSRKANKDYITNYTGINAKNSFLSSLYEIFSNRGLRDYVVREIFKNIEEDNDSSIGLQLMYKQSILECLIVEASLNKDFKIDTFVKEYGKDNKTKNSLINEYIKTEVNKEYFKNIDSIDSLKTLYMSEIGRFCVEYIQEYFMKSSYIKPVRAHADRYYRLRNLSVDEVDSDGKNLAMFINSLTFDKLNAYNKWLDEYFDFKVRPRQTDGHVSINIEKGEKIVKLSDTGYGYSQLLPIITQIWVILNMKEEQDKSIPLVMAIEQPELHLHPALQAKLIDIISKVAMNYKNQIQFLLETHSETMINRFGNLIYKKKISEEDINIIVFEKNIEDDDTSIRISKYDENGYLQNWPIGFFGVDDIE